MKHESFIEFSGEWISDVQFRPVRFSSATLKKLEKVSPKLSIQEKHEHINGILLEAISESEKPCFLMPHVVHFIARVRDFILPTYHLSSFEFWLSSQTGIDEATEKEVRGKIVGKFVPDSTYELFFPIKKEEEKSAAHFAVAHLSPDIDTTVASWIGFLDSFGSRVGKNRNHWVVPGGPPKTVETGLAFYDPLSEHVFATLATTSKSYFLTSLDLVSTQVVKKGLNEPSYGIHHGEESEAVIVVDKGGRFISDWKLRDVDVVRTIINRFFAIFSEFENAFHRDFMILFSEEKVERKDLHEFIDQKLNMTFAGSNLFRELSPRQQEEMNEFIQEVLAAPKGTRSTLSEFFEVDPGHSSFDRVLEAVRALRSADHLFRSGTLVSDRTTIFKALSSVIFLQTEAFRKFRAYIDSLDIAIRIKKRVLRSEPVFVSHLADFDEIHSKMGESQFVTVVYKEQEHLYPLGVIFRSHLKQKPLAAVSLRDFSNFTETNIPPYAEVISVIDHHKTEIKTEAPAMIHVQDVQSVNVLVAQLLFPFNDKIQKHHMVLEHIDHELATAAETYEVPTYLRIMERLVIRKQAYYTDERYFISPEREFLEYYQILIAILDDTDLLTKVTSRDVECVRELINRMKSLLLSKEVEVVHFDDVEQNEDFAKEAAKKLLCTYDLYSLYKHIQEKKEEVLHELIENTLRGNDVDTFFQDTKILGGGYAAVAQFKHFPGNVPKLIEQQQKLHSIWIERCKQEHKIDPEIRLFLFMRSSLPSAEELYQNSHTSLNYRDELWIWIPEGDALALNEMKGFIRSLDRSPKVAGQKITVALSEEAVEMMEKAFHDSFAKRIVYMKEPLNPTMAIIHVKPGSLNSRKTDIATNL